MAISRVITRVTPFRALITKTYNLLTESPAPSSRSLRCLFEVLSFRVQGFGGLGGLGGLGFRA